jgi:hypothetical protein
MGKKEGVDDVAPAIFRDNGRHSGWKEPNALKVVSNLYAHPWL